MTDHAPITGRGGWITRPHADEDFTANPVELFFNLAFVFNNTVVLSPDLAEICRHPDLVETANHYLGRPAHIKCVYGMRYLPKEQPDSHQFGWHHDIEDRMLKVMLLLTDVPMDDQYMTYVSGTQTAFHPYSCFLRNPLSFEQVGVDTEAVRTVDTIGRAGDMFLFDTNGMHRGRRSLSAVHDAVFIEFTADGNHDNGRGSTLGVSTPWFGTNADDPLHIFRNLVPKWDRRADNPRTQTTWAESLPDPEAWIR
jgi:hypothetical protein